MIKKQPRTLGEKLKILRNEKGLSQLEVCKLLGIWQNKLSRYENDMVERPNPEDVKMFANFYGVSESYLILKEGEFSHLQDEILEWVKDPICTSYVVEAYLKYKKDTLIQKLNQG